MIPSLVDDEDRPPDHRPGEHAGRPGEPTCLVLVGEQRHVEALLLGEALVRLDRLRRDPEHVGTELVEPLALVAVGAELLGADRGEVARIEGEDQLAAAVVGELVGLAAGAGQLEVRCRSPTSTLAIGSD